LDLGYSAIGRFSADSRIDLIVEAVSKCRGLVVIVADNDKPHYRPDGTTYFPGQNGATKIANALADRCKRLKICKMPFHKDVRDFVKAGGTRGALDCILRSCRFWQRPP
jgi:hypothetical protein